MGFTDQILAFGLLYKLGAKLGLKYQYSPINPRPNLLKAEAEGQFTFAGPCNGSYTGIFDFLGFDWYFSEKHCCKDIDQIDTVEFLFDQAAFEENAIEDLQGLLDHLRQLVLKNMPAGNAPLHLHFVLRNQIAALRWLHQLPNSLLDFDFAEIYRHFRQERPHPDGFDNNKPGVLMHIRQGDTAVIETPWHSFVQVWGRGRDNFTERSSAADIRDHQRICVADFESFYSDLKAGLEEFELSTQVHSDGFARAFYHLDGSIDRLALSNEQVEQLQSYRDGYDERAFSVFKQHGDARVFVGEDLSLLFELMHAFYTADVVIIGTQQRMLAKQYAYSFTDSGGPLLITLYRHHSPYYNYFGNAKLLANCLYVDLENYHISDVIERVRHFLDNRYRRGRQDKDKAPKLEPAKL